MKSAIRSLGILLAMSCLPATSLAQETAQAGALRLHAIFDSDMVLQCGKLIVIWGWAKPGAPVSVQLGADKADAKAAADKGRWEVTFPFDKRVHPDDQSPIIEGFALAAEDGKYYKAYARHSGVGDFCTATKTVHVWSPLVPKPVHVRYAWGNSPMGNLKVNGHQEMPIPEFRTDSWDLPEIQDLTDKGLTREFSTQWNEDGKARIEYRRSEEAKRALEIIERVKNPRQTQTLIFDKNPTTSSHLT